MIETSRLLLRPFTLDDAPALRAYRNIPDVYRYQAWPAPLTPKGAEEQIKEYLGQSPTEPGWFQYAVEHKADRVLVGDLGLWLHENLRQAEIGFTLAPAYQRRSYGTELVTAILDHLLAGGIHRVSAECDPRDTPSAALLKRVGFQPEGCRPASRR
ncbi:GNAT family N-acetyltransferase [Streptomyces sp. NPDC048527]|uniref:GNAT family N-acetyltransferase n=1 Tax=Streptomyces sp. NPDC048527 TaxID=3365568 RepID=UPI00371539FD